MSSPEQLRVNLLPPREDSVWAYGQPPKAQLLPRAP